jgi:hypothetical protein
MAKKSPEPPIFHPLPLYPLHIQGTGNYTVPSLKINLRRYVMKHTKVILMAALIGLAGIGSVSAQGHDRGRGWGGYYPAVPAETVTVGGRLQLINGEIALVQGTNTYYPHGLQRLAGFIPGLQEGAQVTLEGYSTLMPYTTNVYRFWVSKLTFNGKEYANLNMKR